MKHNKINIIVRFTREILPVDNPSYILNQKLLE